MSDPAERAREHVLTERRGTVETVLSCADAVAAGWPGDATTDPGAVAGPLRERLESAGAWSELPGVLAGAVRAAGYSLPAEPVADPPYVVSTSRGPMLRGTVTDGRLVVRIVAFRIVREDGPRYVRGPSSAGRAVRAAFG